MKCFNCETIGSIHINDNYTLCYDCFHFRDTIISHSNVIHIYLLTDDEINDAKLTIAKDRGVGRIKSGYLAFEIHELARKITENLHYNNKRKIAFMEYDSTLKDKKDKEEKLAKLKEILTNETNIMLQKYNIVIDRFVKRLLRAKIDHYCSLDNINFTFNVSMKICEEIDNYCTMFTKMNELIRKNFGEKYVTLVKDLDCYRDWFTTFTDIDLAYEYMEPILQRHFNNADNDNDTKLNEILRDELLTEYIGYTIFTNKDL
ncbi:MAG: hypothetical protein Barrevirus22_7 [Barrevirus sp.]|uniref:Uncharacterized protein n=1 Tax=Barrevirus sp. TaxID=2487763 RepID=A0A3G4ZTA5_9VIRU|nr:MAG: hypothetical protein Barrevirus22_7 [Barrevirus sp.]